MREGQAEPITDHHTIVYRYAMAHSVKRVLFYGIMGGLLYGVLLQLPFRFLFNQLLLPVTPMTDTVAVILIFGQLVLLLIGLAILLYFWGRRWSASTRRQRYVIGAGVGLIFALVTFQALTGSVSAIIAGRQVFDFLYQAYDTESAEFLLVLGHGIAHILLEVIGMALLTSLLLTGVGAVLGRFLIPIGKLKAGSQVRDTFVAWLALVLPPAMLIAAVANAVIWAMMQMSFTGGDWAAAGVEAGLLALLSSAIMVLPYIVMVATQLLALLWLLLSDGRGLHRSMLRLTQILYGLFMGALQIGLLLVVNPGYVRSDLGRTIWIPSVILAWMYVITAQVKLRRARQSEEQARIVIPVYRTVRAGTAVAFIGWLLVDMLVIRVSLSLVDIVVRLIAAAPQTVTLDPTLDGLLAHVLHEDFLVMVGIGVIVVAISAVVLYPVAWLVTFSERRGRNRCPSCQTIIHLEADFCPHCGHDLSQSSAELIELPRRRWRNAIFGTARGFLRRAVSVAVLSVLFLVLVVLIVGQGGLVRFNDSTRYPSGQASPTPIPMMEVVTAVQELRRGFRIPPGAIELRLMPVDAAPYGVITDIDAAINTVALTDVVREQPITYGMLAYDLYDTDFLGRPIAYMPPEGTLTLLGGPVIGVLNDNNLADEWLFQGEPGESYTFTLLAMDGDLRPALMVWAKDSERWMGGQSAPNNGMVTLTLPLPDEETVVVVVFRERATTGGTAGPYELAVQVGRDAP